MRAYEWCTKCTACDTRRSNKSWSVYALLFRHVAEGCVCGGGGKGEGGEGAKYPQIRQIILKSCSFSPKTEFIPLKVASKSGVS